MNEEVLADLRAKVAALQAEYENATDADHAYYALRDVLALIDEAICITSSPPV